MNWRISALDKYVLVSNSDAHSPSRLGREANLFNTDFSYRGLVDALRRKNSDQFLRTIEFFPEEGKYHYDGHRKCGVVFSPKESIAHKGLCPKCGKKLTIGVLHRIEELADREENARPPLRVPYQHLVPLNEIIAEAIEKTPECQSVWDIYFRLIHEFGSEQAVLTAASIADLARIQPERISQGVDRMRKGAVRIAPGHDGFYGRVSLFEPDLPEGNSAGQLNLF
jgi:uncharacterized protein (TIGR00375 family)